MVWPMKHSVVNKTKYFIIYLILCFSYPIKKFLLWKRYRITPILSFMETINYILNNKVSVTRYGDGEVIWMAGFSACEFEPQNDKLASELKRGLNLEKGLFICINGKMFNKGLHNCPKEIKKHYRGFVRSHALDIINFFPKERTYGDACFTRLFREYPGMPMEYYAGLYNIIKKIWDKKNLLIIEGENVKFGVFNDLLSNTRSIGRIVCPDTNSYKFIDEIETIVKANIEKYDLAIFVLGPTATVLVYRLFLSCKGAVFIDIGSINNDYQLFLEKYNIGVVNNISEYEKEILAIIR